MLFKVKMLKGIKSGEISLAFRKWKKPLVKKGSLIKTAVGQIEILSISEFLTENISKEAALSAGYKSLNELTKILNSRTEGNIYKLKLRYHSPDPRIELRNQTNLSEEVLNEIKAKLERLDKFSPHGSWTLQILKAIQKQPKLRAQDLADETGFPKDWLKPNIRKLKNMGLTISLPVGYMVSPRGEVVLEKLFGN